MLQLLEPIWLAAMGGVVVPVFVHLWNDKRGKVLRIGSVALLSEGSKRMAWRRRISQWWLLILRCMLLLALALLLARPYWQRRPRGKGWVLTADPAIIAGGVVAASGRYSGVVDSLVAAGYEKHLLTDTMNYWAGFRVADREAPAGLPFYVFTPGLVSRFSGERPVTSRFVHWNVYAPADSAERWVQRAWAVARDSMVVLNGLGRATGTSWERRTTARTVNVNAGAMDGGPVDTAILRYRAYGDDAKYVVAAMKALARVTERPIAEGDGGWIFGRRGGVSVDSAEWRKSVWDGRLPMLLADLLPLDTPRRDIRMIDPRQAAPAHRQMGQEEKEALEDVDLRPMIWWLMLLLFVLERVIAFNEKA